MKFKFLSFLTFCSVLFIISCNKDEIVFNVPTQELRFSRDTVFCDTVYHQVRSETYAVKVYNDENQDILIPRIRLEKGNTSLYKINVDGKPGTDFSNVPLRKKDSLFIFVEIAPEANGTESIAEDKILFSTPVGEQKVTLFSVVQDAEFFIQTGAAPVSLNTNTNWTNSKAKIIYGNLKLSPNITLNVQEGTKIYFHKNSGMQLESGANLNLNGNLNNQIIIRGDRNDTYYDTIPKQWNSIKLDQGAAINMNHTRLFGGTRGIEMQQATANISNSFIHTFEEYGIYAVQSTVVANNLVMNNAGEACVGIFKGGNHQYTHATIANYSDLLGALPRNGFFVSNAWENTNGQISQGGLQQFKLLNSIVYSDHNNAVEFAPTSGQQFEYLIQNSLLKYGNSTEAGFSFDSNPRVVQSIKNEDPQFKNYFIAEMNLRVKPTSPARNKGIPSNVPNDIVGVPRTGGITLGAYQ